MAGAEADATAATAAAAPAPAAVDAADSPPLELGMLFPQAFWVPGRMHLLHTVSGEILKAFELYEARGSFNLPFHVTRVQSTRAHASTV